MNPYETPHAELSDPIYDWTLAKRIAWFVIRLSIFFAVILFLMSWHQYSRICPGPTGPSAWEELRSFFFGWPR